MVLSLKVTSPSGVNRPDSIAPCLVALSVLACCCGCSALRVQDRWFDSDRVCEVPSEVLPIWTDTVLHHPGQPAVRGFGGRLYFYQQGKPDPVQVDGQLAVYVFEAGAGQSDNVAPLKKFVFTPQQLLNHHSKTSLGNSYSVWIPWDQVGGPTETLSLVARFDGRRGGTVLSKPSKKLLPGLDNQRSQEASTAEVRLASHEAKDDEVPNSEAAGTLETISIDLPPSFQRRLRGTAAQRTERTLRNGETSLEAVTNFNASGSSEVEAEEPLWEIPHWMRRGPTTPAVVHSSPQRFPARRTPRVQPGRAPLRRQPHPAGWPSVLPPTPRTGWSTQSDTGSPARVEAAGEIADQSGRSS